MSCIKSEKQSVLVIGASRGIGAAVATRFVEEGFAVAGSYRGSGVPSGVTPITADVRDSESVRACVDAAVRELGSLDILVVASGITRDALLLRMGEEDLREVMEVNAIGPMLACRAALRPMLKQRRGSIVLISSMSVKYGVVGQTNYTASKGAIEAFARSLAREHGRQGIRVNTVAPGATDTDMMRDVPDAERDAMLEQIPAGRLGTPEEIADVVFHTALAGYMSGATVPVGGGI